VVFVAAAVMMVIGAGFDVQSRTVRGGRRGLAATSPANRGNDTEALNVNVG
jgi:hypothetical protein